jgi:hypothetical protein
MHTPKAFANLSPGFEHRENPGIRRPNKKQTLKALGLCGVTLSGLNRGDCRYSQGCRLCSNPGLKLANAFGVILVKFQTDTLVISFYP